MLSIFIICKQKHAILSCNGPAIHHLVTSACLYISTYHDLKKQFILV